MTERSRGRRFAVAIGALGMLLVSASGALAQAGDPLVVEDPLKKVKDAVDRKVAEVEDTAEGTTEKVEAVVEETGAKADETVQTVESKVDETVQTVGSKVDKVVNPTETKPQPTGTNPPGTQTETTPTTGGGDSKKTERAERTKVAGAFIKDRGNARGGPASVVLLERLPRDRAGIIHAAGPVDEPPLLAAPPVTPGEVAERLAFPLTMTLAVLVFLLIQGRFDRTDVKLLAFDVDGDSLSFE